VSFIFISKCTKMHLATGLGPDRLRQLTVLTLERKGRGMEERKGRVKRRKERGGVMIAY